MARRVALPSLRLLSWMFTARAVGSASTDDSSSSSSDGPEEWAVAARARAKARKFQGSTI